eukprot:COSAG02_NODE_6433_length_3571_cov_2.170507_3_plen_67_part_00
MMSGSKPGLTRFGPPQPGVTGQTLSIHQFYSLFSALEVGTAVWELLVDKVWWWSCACMWRACHRLW